MTSIRVSEDSLLQALSKLVMGCICAKESIVVDGVTYRILEQIAEGGFSTIDLVEHVRTRDKFALKRITCHSTEDQIAAQREIEFHKHLEHPAILELEASAVIGSADIMHNVTSEVLLLLPYYPRGTLHDELVRREVKKEPFSEEFALKLFQQICEAVHFMHSIEPQPLAHRDLKPHNVLLTRDMRPVIMDLGSTTTACVSIKTHSEAQHLQDVAAERCSITYRPPELFQVNSRCEIDERTDVWSLGCLLYAMCFFKSPFDTVFERGDSVALAVQGNNLKFPPNSTFSTDMHNVITWMLTPNIAVRPYLSQIMDRIQDMLNNTSTKETNPKV
ncbi:serine/threonine-protein kinase 16-like [Tigriopus californicus]|uniref:serine/threonine-protein kinase 16-like n=1 Tax=Tigriopus californicus TaxID=6832 RepID=UPI0027D9F655|nr:serine/threonine-protein kinase 16-like [Tigriopus californicus]